MPHDTVYTREHECSPEIWISFNVDETPGLASLLALIEGYPGLQLVRCSESYWIAILAPGGALEARC
jgi:hypothetical protein